MQSKTKKKGFTIVELVIVIAVIGILTAVLVPTFTGLVQKAQETAKQENMRNAMIQFQADAADGHIGESGDVALPQNVKEDQLQMTLDGVSYVFNKESGSWNAGKFVAVSAEDAAAAGTPYARRAFTPLANLGPNDIAYNGEKYKLMYVGANFKGYSEYNNCLVQFLAKISDYQDFIDNAAEDDADYFLATVAQNEHYADYLYNSTVPSTRDDGFKITARPFLVGDDNPYEFKPKIVMIDAEGNPAPESAWDKEFDVTVEVENAGSFVEADPALYSLPETLTIDNLKIDFADEAVDHTFRITTKPSVSSGLSASRIAKFTQSLTVNVIDGFNVYKGLDLAYLDDTRDGYEMAYGDVDAASYTSNWETFKNNHSFPVNFAAYPNTLIFQDNIAISRDDFPINDFTYGSEEDNPGTLINDCAIYRITDNRDVVVEGNYFQLDASAIPLVHLGPKQACTAALFQPGHPDRDQSSLVFRNLNITGNSRYATSNDDSPYAGGYTFLKGHYNAKVLGMENCIARSCFQTVQAEYGVSGAWNSGLTTGASQSTAEYIDAVINDCKFFDNYNVFIYSYGGHVHANRTLFRKCGGPIILQDHVFYGSKYKEAGLPTKYYEDGPAPGVPGAPIPWIPDATFTDCELDNYVVGTEPWFVQWEIVPLFTGKLKPLSILLSASAHQSFVLDPTTHQATSATAENGVINFIAANKSEDGVGDSAINVCGKVTIVSSGDAECFSYAGEDPTSATRGAIQYINSVGGPVFQRDERYATVNENHQLTELDGQTAVTHESAWATADVPHGGIYFMGILMVIGMVEVTPNPNA